MKDQADCPLDFFLTPRLQFTTKAPAEQEPHRRALAALVLEGARAHRAHRRLPGEYSTEAHSTEFQDIAFEHDGTIASRLAETGPLGCARGPTRPDRSALDRQPRRAGIGRAVAAAVGIAGCGQHWHSYGRVLASDGATVQLTRNTRFDSAAATQGHRPAGGFDRRKACRECTTAGGTTPIRSARDSRCGGRAARGVPGGLSAVGWSNLPDAARVVCAAVARLAGPLWPWDHSRIRRTRLGRILNTGCGCQLAA